ncbi:MAG TPA: Bax inhibitor-1/YccA family protein [Crocinitomix sp.]|nr:Bax inhibitor-1/YccA family protein [Crocinitomix sp.]
MRNEIIDNQYSTAIESAELSKTFMSKVFSWMFVALALSGVAAYLFGTTPELLRYLINFETGGMTILGWVVMLAPLGLVMLMSFRVQKMSFSALFMTFIAYSVITGISLSFIFLAYTMSSIAVTFFVTAGTFGIMALLGYTTRTDLTKFGSILYMALIGLIIASVVNWFLGSSTMDYIISGIGVLIFTGLTAYDTQKLKNIGAQVDAYSEVGKKSAIMGALSLYLDFINLFLFLLRFMGDRN